MSDYYNKQLIKKNLKEIEQLELLKTNCQKLSLLQYKTGIFTDEELEIEEEHLINKIDKIDKKINELKKKIEELKPKPANFDDLIRKYRTNELKPLIVGDLFFMFCHIHNTHTIFKITGETKTQFKCQVIKENKNSFNRDTSHSSYFVQQIKYIDELKDGIKRYKKTTLNDETGSCRDYISPDCFKEIKDNFFEIVEDLYN